MAEDYKKVILRDSETDDALYPKTDSTITLYKEITVYEAIDTLRQCISTGDIGDLLIELGNLGEGYSSLSEVARTLKNFLESIDATNEAINTWQEIEKFLEGITDSESLLELLQKLQATLEVEINNVEAQAVAAQKTADEAMDEASSAYDMAEAAYNRADSALTTATDAKEVAEEAKTSAEQALTAANDAQTTADEAQATADEALATAEDASETADRAYNYAVQANDNAQEALEAANEAKEEIEGIIDDVVLDIEAEGTAPLTLDAERDGSTVKIVGSVDTYDKKTIDEMIGVATAGGLTHIEASGESPLILEAEVSGTTATITGRIDSTPRMEIDTQGDQFISYNDPEPFKVTCSVWKGWKDITDTVKAWLVGRDSGDELEDTAWDADHTNFAGYLELTYADLGMNISTRFNFTATDEDNNKISMQMIFS